MSMQQPWSLEKHVLGSAFVSTTSAFIDDDSTMAMSSPRLGQSPRGPLTVAEFSAQLKSHLAPISEEVRANKNALDKLQDSILQLSTNIEASRSTQTEAISKHWDTALERHGLHLKASQANQELSKANVDQLKEIDTLRSRGSVHDIDKTIASSSKHASTSKAKVSELERPSAPPLTNTLDITLRSLADGVRGEQIPRLSVNAGTGFFDENDMTGCQTPQTGRGRTRLNTPAASIHIPANQNNMLAVVAEHLEYRESTTTQEWYIGNLYFRLVRRFLEWLSNLQEPPRTTVLAKVVDSTAFALFFGLVILVNLVSLSVDANHQMDHSINNPFEHLEWLFLILYSVEIALKLAVHKWYLFIGPGYAWNIFDAFLVAVSLYSNVMSLLLLDRSQSASSVQTLRIFKIGRIFKAIRLIRIFSIMERILRVMAGTLFILVGGVLMMSLLLFVFGLLCVHLLASDGMDAQSEPVLFDEVRSIFGSVQLGMFTLFRSTLGGEDWNKYFQVIVQVSPLTAAILIFFVAFVQISFFNILTAMFVVQTKILGKPDQLTKAMEETLKQRRDVEQIQQLCKDLDKDGSQTISREEFEESLKNDQIRSRFMLCGLNITNAEDFFELLLGMSSDNDVEIQQFVKACVMMKGDASAIEQNMILLEARDFQHKVANHFLRLKYWQTDVNHKLDALATKGLGARMF